MYLLATYHSKRLETTTNIKDKNLAPKAFASFGKEWSRFYQNGMTTEEAQKVFAEGFDMGCRSGRWARWVALNVGRLHCIDPFSAIEVARTNLAEFGDVVLHRASVGESTLRPGS